MNIWIVGMRGGGWVPFLFVLRGLRGRLSSVTISKMLGVSERGLCMVVSGEAVSPSSVAWFLVVSVR